MPDIRGECSEPAGVLPGTLLLLRAIREARLPAALEAGRRHDAEQAARARQRDLVAEEMRAAVAALLGPGAADGGTLPSVTGGSGAPSC
jgi:hypothetical protein